MQSLHLKIQKVLYCVSSLGVTDVRSKITTDISAMVDLVREVTDVPVAVEFGAVSYTHLRAHETSLHLV